MSKSKENREPMSARFGGTSPEKKNVLSKKDLNLNLSPEKLS